MKIIRFLVYGNIVVSFSAGMLALSGAFRNSNPHYFALGVTVFCATLFVYNIQRLLRIRELGAHNSPHLLWVHKHKKLILLLSLSGFTGAAAIYFLILGYKSDFWALGLSVLLCVLYALKIHPKLNGLRDIPFVKIYLIAGFWALITVLWPHLRFPDTSVFSSALSVSVFFYILAATIPFDIRDLPYDTPEKKTIPQMAGITGAKIIALACLAVSAFSLHFVIADLLRTFWFYIAFLGMGILIVYSSTGRHELYFSGWIDLWISSYALLLYYG